MSFSRDSWLHELSLASITMLLRDSAWQTANQSIDSACTNDNNATEPDHHYLDSCENTAGVNAFADIQFSPSVKSILDVGGGRFDANRNYMQTRGVILHVWDPYNRSMEHNDAVKALVEKAKQDAVTSMSVLNVIPECEARLAHIVTVNDALKTGGRAYFKIWPGEGLFVGSYLSTERANAYQANALPDRFLHEVEVVFGLGNVKLHSRIPNLIVVKKTSDKTTPENDILTILEQSKEDSQKISQIKAARLKQIEARISNLSGAVNHFYFFSSAMKNQLISSRHDSAAAQEAYDRQFGLVLRR